MLSMLPPSEADRVHCFYLGTPFIIRKKRFGSVISHDEGTPLDSLMFFACLYSVFGILPALIIGLSWNPFDLSQSNYSLILDFWQSPHIGSKIRHSLTHWNVIWLFTSFLACMIISFVITDLQNQPERQTRKYPGRKRNDHAFIYSTDEAIMGLQLVSSLTNFVHQVLFVILSILWKIVNKGNAFEIAVMTAVLAGAGVGILYRYLYTTLLSFLWETPIGTILDGIVWIIFPFGVVILSFMIFIGTITCTIFFIVTLFALMRGIILLVTGMTDREFPRNAFQRLLYDEFSIAAAPLGSTNITVVAGNRLINHTSIYEDIETIDIIAKAIKLATGRSN